VVGASVGAGVGLTEGKAVVGVSVGAGAVGRGEGATDGRSVGVLVGASVGALLGVTVGASVGALLGDTVGRLVGDAVVGASVGVRVLGATVGLIVGGGFVGARVGIGVVGLGEGARVGVPRTLKELNEFKALHSPELTSHPLASLLSTYKLLLTLHEVQKASLQTADKKNSKSPDGSHIAL
jgi:hypothetical protein